MSGYNYNRFKQPKIFKSLSTVPKVMGHQDQSGPKNLFSLLGPGSLNREVQTQDTEKATTVTHNPAKD
jgi:hypothetical protein